MSQKTVVLFSTVCLCGASVIIYGVHGFHADNVPRFIVYLVLCGLASRLKVGLPSIEGTISVNFLFILLSMVELNFGETLAIGLVATLAQMFHGFQRWPKFKQAAFNLGNSASTIFATCFFYDSLQRYTQHKFSPLVLTISACIYFLGNTLPVAGIVCLSEGKKLRDVWNSCFFWYFPYYLAGAVIAGTVGWVNQKIGWQTSLLAMPAMFVIYRSYRLYLSKLENETSHVKAMAGLHLRTIEALALAIEAKDQTTYDHL